MKELPIVREPANPDCRFEVFRSGDDGRKFLAALSGQRASTNPQGGLPRTESGSRRDHIRQACSSPVTVPYGTPRPKALASSLAPHRTCGGLP